MPARMLALLLAASPALAADPGALPWMQAGLAPGDRAARLVGAMTLDEKLGQLIGTPGVIAELPQCYGARHVDGIARLHIPTLRVTNGPVGIGQSDCVPLDTPGLPFGSLSAPTAARATALVSALGLAASFDLAAASAFGDVLGAEARSLGLQVLEAPGVNLARVPQGGRNFEYFGEDPMLAGSMAAAEIRAVQRRGVIAMAKHFVANEQETDRGRIQATIDDRVLHELYLLPFEMAVRDGEVAAVMCAYNAVNGAHMCENRPLLTGVLRGQWRFDGYVQSDFFAVHSVAPTLRAGMDLEMPGLAADIGGAAPTGPHLTPASLRAALAAGQIEVADLDTALLRRYRQMFRLGIFDRPVARTPIDADEGARAALMLGEQSAVLLKNVGELLPLDPGALRSIAVIGQAAYAAQAVAGCCGGSSDVIPLRTVTPLAGLREAARALGAPVAIELTLVDTDARSLARAVAAAKAADAVIVLAGALTDEGADRPSLSLPDGQDAMIEAVAAANPRTIVVLKDGGPVLMPWLDRVPAVLEAWFPGGEDGSIVARLLFGQANPSGKLPVTYPKAAADVPAATPAQYPGVAANGVPAVTYAEGLEIGYRWHDARAIAPAFPFGHGLSYTRFAVSAVDVAPRTIDAETPIRVSCIVENTGTRRGAEVLQVYLGLPAGTGEPPKRLGGFAKIWLEPGERRRVEITVDPRASSHPLAIWDSFGQRWRTEAGDYQVLVGTSSADIVARATLTLRP